MFQDIISIKNQATLRRTIVLGDTYDRRIQLDASRHRYEDAKSLQRSGRWNGAIYLAGYAIECSLKALICYEGCTNNLKETRIFKQGRQGAALHNLGALREASIVLERAFRFDTDGKLKSAWTIIVGIWQKDALRYSQDLGHQAECERFLKAVEVLHHEILKRQGEA